MAPSLSTMAVFMRLALASILALVLALSWACAPPAVRYTTATIQEAKERYHAGEWECAPVNVIGYEITDNILAVEIKYNPETIGVIFLQRGRDVWLQTLLADEYLICRDADTKYVEYFRRASLGDINDKPLPGM